MAECQQNPSEPNELLDPYTSIVNDMEIGQDDAAYMASFVDSSKIISALKKAKYTVKMKIEKLTDVIADSKSTVGETMRAMKMIDDMLAASLASRGIMMTPNQISGVTSPIGQPQPVHSITMTQKSVQLVMDASEKLEDVSEEKQPLKEQDDGKKEDSNPEQDAFFEDERSGNDNIFRGAQTD